MGWVLPSVKWRLLPQVLSWGVVLAEHPLASADLGRGLAVLGEHADAPGAAWHLPNDPDTRTTRRLVEIVYEKAGQPRARFRILPPLVLRAMGVINPTMRELLEMQYQFEEPFIVDSSRMANKLGAAATPVEQALDETLDT